MERFNSTPGSRAGLPYIPLRYIGLCGAIRYCFRAVWTEIKCGLVYSGQQLGMILGRNCFCDGYYSSLEKCDLSNVYLCKSKQFLGEVRSERGCPFLGQVKIG